MPRINYYTMPHLEDSGRGGRSYEDYGQRSANLSLDSIFGEMHPFMKLSVFRLNNIDIVKKIFVSAFTCVHWKGFAAPNRRKRAQTRSVR